MTTHRLIFPEQEIISSNALPPYVDFAAILVGMAQPHVSCDAYHRWCVAASLFETANAFNLTANCDAHNYPLRTNPPLSPNYLKNQTLVL